MIILTRALLVSFWTTLQFPSVRLIYFSSLKIESLLVCAKNSSISLALLPLSTNRQVFILTILVLKIKCLFLTLGTLFCIAYVEIFTCFMASTFPINILFQTFLLTILSKDYAFSSSSDSEFSTFFTFAVLNAFVLLGQQLLLILCFDSQQLQQYLSLAMIICLSSVNFFENAWGLFHSLTHPSGFLLVGLNLEFR